MTTSNKKRIRNNTLLIIGLVLLAIGIILSLITYRTSYTQSIAIGKELTAIKEQIAAIEAGTATGDLEALLVEQNNLSASKLHHEKPYSYALTFSFFSLLLVIKGLYNCLHGFQNNFNKMDVTQLVQAGLLAALCYIGFAFLRIDIPVGPEKTAVHFGNAFCVLAALLLGGFWGGLAGAVGMTVADLTTAYVTSAPKTFLLKLCIGLIVGLVAHTIFKVSRPHTKKYVTGVTIFACTCGMLFNIIADPLVGYFYKTYLLGISQDITKVLVIKDIGATSVNAVTAITSASVIYLALRPALKKSGLFIQISPDKDKKEKKDF